MIKSHIPYPRLVRNGLVNKSPILCPLCEKYVAAFAGIPVILDDKASIIEFAHTGCCADAI
jgi:hypothetical protein